MDNKNITIWGDSILKGVIYDEFEGKYKVLENSSINKFTQITGMKVNNNAKFGMTSTKAVKRIASQVDKTEFTNNDLVILEFGGNDCDFNWSNVALDPNRSHSPNTPIESFKETFQNIIDIFKNKGVKPVLMTLPPLEPQLYFNWISKELSKDNILKWLGDVTRIYRWQEAYNSAVVWLAQRNGCQLIDVRENFLLSDNYSSLFCLDGIHPNEKGHERILEALLNFIKSEPKAAY